MITPHGPIEAGEISEDIVIGAASGYKIARGQHTTISADDTVATGLATVVAAIAVLDDDPVLTAAMASCSIGNQSDAPVAGSVYIKTWMPTSTSVTDPVAATTFTKKVNWIAIGT